MTDATCEVCATPLVVRPDEPGIRTRWYACPECDEPRNPDGSVGTESEAGSELSDDGHD